MSLPGATDGKTKIGPNKENTIQFQQPTAYFL